MRKCAECPSCLMWVKNVLLGLDRSFSWHICFTWSNGAHSSQWPLLLLRHIVSPRFVAVPETSCVRERRQCVKYGQRFVCILSGVPVDEGVKRRLLHRSSRTSWCLTRCEKRGSVRTEGLKDSWSVSFFSEQRRTHTQRRALSLAAPGIIRRMTMRESEKTIQSRGDVFISKIRGTFAQIWHLIANSNHNKDCISPRRLITAIPELSAVFLCCLIHLCC